MRRASSSRVKVCHEIFSFTGVHIEVKCDVEGDIIRLHLSPRVCPHSDGSGLTFGVVADRTAEVRWADCITWTEADLLKVRVVREILEMGRLDLLKVADLIGDHVERLWERNRTDFRYLKIRAPFWVTLLAGILVLAVFLWVAHIAVTTIVSFPAASIFRFRAALPERQQSQSTSGTPEDLSRLSGCNPSL